MSKYKRAAKTNEDKRRSLRNTLASPLKAKEKTTVNRTRGNNKSDKKTKPKETLKNQKSNVLQNIGNNTKNVRSKNDAVKKIILSPVPGYSSWSPSRGKAQIVSRNSNNRRSIRNILHSKLSKIDKSAAKNPISIKNIEFALDNSLQLMKRDGIEYAVYPLRDSIYRSGIVLIKPGGRKKSKKTLLNMKYTVILGALQFIFEDKVLSYKQQDVVTVPTGVRYGIKNPTNQNCFLTFFTHS